MTVESVQSIGNGWQYDDMEAACAVTEALMVLLAHVTVRLAWLLGAKPIGSTKPTFPRSPSGGSVSGCERACRPNATRRSSYYLHASGRLQLAATALQPD